MTQEAAAPTLREAELIDELRAVARAYPEDVFLPLDDEDKKHPLTIQRASAAMGRHMAPLLLRAAAALAARPADPVEPATLPSSRERWNAENPGELSLHTFDDDDTPAEPSVRADALRYQFLRHGADHWIFAAISDSARTLEGDELDAAIDAAIAQMNDPT